MKSIKKDKMVNLHIGTFTHIPILNENYAQVNLEKLKGTENRKRFLIEVKLRTQFCILEIETKKTDLIFEFLLKEKIDFQINQDVYNLLLVFNDLYDQIKGGADIIEVNLSLNKSFKKYKSLRTYGSVKNGVNMEYIIIDNEKNRDIVKQFSLNLDFYLNHLKNVLLPRIDLEIQKTQLESESISHKNISPSNIDLSKFESEKILWKGTKQDLVALYDKLIDIGLVIPTKAKDQLLNNHFVLITDKGDVEKLGELKHARKLLKDYAKPSAKMQIIIDSIEKDFSVDNK